MPLAYWADNDDTKEKRQAEFLVHESFPWTAIERIGVQNDGVALAVSGLLAGAATPPVTIEPTWYY
jgi:hypothetical protein